MKIKKKIIGVFICSAVLLLFSSFYFSFFQVKQESKSVLQKNFNSSLLNLQKQALVFESVLGKSEDKKVILKNYFKLREAYKRISFLTQYLDVEHTKKYINGAPLPYLEKKVPNLVVLEPQGFQVLDELLFEHSFNLLETKKIGKQLSKDLQNMCLNMSSKDLQWRELLESLRYGILDVMALSVTGFDTPGSLNALKDAQSSLEGMQFIISNTFVANKELIQELKTAIGSIKKAKNFNDFDRYSFYRNDLLPIYSRVVSLHEASGIEFDNEVFNFENTINFHAKSPFQADFLNTDAFSNLSKDLEKKAIADLGQLLFFDPILSKNDERACASCHNPKNAFSDGLKTSIAFDFEGNLDRNSPTLLNSVFAEKFFWDLRSTKLSGQFEHVIFSKKEFNTSHLEIIQKLNKSEEYKALFAKTFTGIYQGKINTETIALSLEAYVCTLVGFNSKFDQAMNKQIDLNQEEIDGFNLFAGKAACATCHFLPTFSGLVPPFYKESESEVLGVPLDAKYSQLDTDLGRAASGIVKEETDIYIRSFKTVTLRNIEKTSPYMHNGVFNTLDEVMEFYNNGGGIGHGFDVKHQTLASDSLHLSETEIHKIITFMHALNDTNSYQIPTRLPKFGADSLINNRTIGGKY